MGGLRFFRLFCLSLLGGFLAAVVVVALVRRWRNAAVARLPERPQERIVIAEVVP